MLLPCDKCKGQCCTMPAFSESEFAAVKAVHGVPPGTIIQKVINSASYEKSREGQVGIIPIKQNGDCAYLNNGKCGIYNTLRPKVCRDYGIVSDLPCQFLYPEQAKQKVKEWMRKARE